MPFVKDLQEAQLFANALRDRVVASLDKNRQPIKPQPFLPKDDHSQVR